MKGAAFSLCFVLLSASKSCYLPLLTVFPQALMEMYLTGFLALSRYNKMLIESESVLVSPK